MLRVTCYVLQSHQKHRQENIDFNNNRVNEAETEAELWKIANEVTNPKKQNEWAIELNGEIVKEEKIIEHSSLLSNQPIVGGITN